MPNAQLLGSAIGIKVVGDVPFITGLDKFLGTEVTDSVRDYYLGNKVKHQMALDRVGAWWYLEG